MQYKLPRNVVIWLSLVALALIAVYYYVHKILPPQNPPHPLHVAVDQQKLGDTSENQVLPIAAQSNEEKKSHSNMIEESQVTEGGPPQQVPSETPTARTSSPPPVVQPIAGTEVSRKASNTYSNPGYPGLSKDMGRFGQFIYRDTSGGRIEIDPQWVNANIVTIVLPGINRAVQVHKEAAQSFLAAFNYIAQGTATINGQEVPLLSLIRSMDGTFVSRHVNWNPTRGLSNHSWGIAIDINADDHFRYIDPVAEPDDPNLILWKKAFQPAGFSWGNSYSDSMHFELLK